MNSKVSEVQAPQSDKLLSLGFVQNILKGSGQVMFQNSMWTGLFF